MTSAPAATIFGAHSLDTAEPADMSTMSVPLKSKYSSAFTFSVVSPKETSVPMEFVDASATTSLAGNARSARTLSISRPTLPVAPTTATLYDITSNPFERERSRAGREHYCKQVWRESGARRAPAIRTAKRLIPAWPGEVNQAAARAHAPRNVAAKRVKAVEPIGDHVVMFPATA